MLDINECSTIQHAMMVRCLSNCAECNIASTQTLMGDCRADLDRVWGGVAAAELAAFLKTELPEMIDCLDPNVAARVKAADDMPAWDYVRRRTILDSLYQSAAARMADVDAVLTPTVAITPPTLASLQPEGAYPKANMHALRNTVIANFLGLCALTLPVGKASCADGEGHYWFVVKKHTTTTDLRCYL